MMLTDPIGGGGNRNFVNNYIIYCCKWNTDLLIQLGCLFHWPLLRQVKLIDDV